MNPKPPMSAQPRFGPVSLTIVLLVSATVSLVGKKFRPSAVINSALGRGDGSPK